MPEASALSDVVLYTAKKTESWKLGAVADLQVGWEANRPGSMSFRVPLAQLQQLPAGSSGGLLDVDVFAAPSGVYRSDLLGKWVEYEHPTAGFCGGRITNVQHEDGMVSVGAEGYLSLLKGRRYAPTTQTETSLEDYLRAALGDPKGGSGAPKYKDFGIEKVTYKSLALSTDLTIAGSGGDVLDDVIGQALDLLPPNLTAQMEMRTRQLTLFDLWGTSGTTLSAGRSVAGWAVTEDLWAGANQVRVQTRYLDSAKRKRVGVFTGKADASITRLGVVERDLVELRGLRGTLNIAQNRADKTAAQLANDFNTFTLRLVDEDGVFEALAVGNTTGVVSARLDLGGITQGPTSSVRPLVWVVARSLDVASGVMTATAIQPQVTG